MLQVSWSAKGTCQRLWQYTTHMAAYSGSV